MSAYSKWSSSRMPARRNRSSISSTGGVRSVARAFRRLLDAEAEGLWRHVCAPAELLDQITEAGWTSRCRAFEERRDVSTQASRAIVMGGERHHQVAIVLHPFLFAAHQQVDQVGLHKARIAPAQ